MVWNYPWISRVLIPRIWGPKGKGWLSYIQTVIRSHLSESEWVQSSAFQHDFIDKHIPMSITPPCQKTPTHLIMRDTVVITVITGSSKSEGRMITWRLQLKLKPVKPALTGSLVQCRTRGEHKNDVFSPDEADEANVLPISCVSWSCSCHHLAMRVQRSLPFGSILVQHVCVLSRQVFLSVQQLVANTCPLVRRRAPRVCQGLFSENICLLASGNGAVENRTSAGSSNTQPQFV